MITTARNLLLLTAALTLSTSSTNAASVKATLSRGTLTISGKCDESQLSVIPGYSSPIFDLLAPYDSLRVANGSNSLGVFPIEDVQKVVIKARGELDYVLVSMVNFVDVSVTTGAKADLVEVNGAIGNLDISTGEKNDTVCLASATIQGTTRVVTGSGDDVLTLGTYCPCLDEEHGDDLVVVDPVQPPVVNFLDDVTVLLGAGRDELHVFAANFATDEPGVVALAELMDVAAAPLAQILRIKVRLNGGRGRDALALYSSNIPLNEYTKSFQIDITDESLLTPGL